MDRIHVTLFKVLIKKIFFKKTLQSRSKVETGLGKKTFFIRLKPNEVPFKMGR